MTIPNFLPDEVDRVISSNFTPSDFITDPKRLVGRERYLTQIRRALFSPGRHIFVSGERGVGKTSLAMTAAKENVESPENFVYVPCGEDSTFHEVIQFIGQDVLEVKNRIASGGGWSAGGGLSIPGIGGINANFKNGEPTAIQKPESWADVYGILKYVRSKRKGRIIVVVDEIDRVRHEEKKWFAELLKNVGTQVSDMRFVFCGIGANVDEILGEHLSTGRMFEPVEIERLSHDMLWRIISDATQQLGLNVPRGMLIRIGIISDGFPHFVHLIGQCLIYSMLDDRASVAEATKRHFSEALTEALQKTEPSLKKIYSMATEKSRSQAEYEEVLWALADRTETKRKLDEIIVSYESIFQQRYSGVSAEDRPRALGRNKLNHRLLALRDERHARILLGHGSGFFSFREGVVRGYVRLMAEYHGISLGEELLD